MKMFLDSNWIDFNSQDIKIQLVDGKRKFTYLNKNIPKRTKLIYECEQCNKEFSTTFEHFSLIKICKVCSMKKSIQEKYGVSHPSKMPSFKEKTSLSWKSKNQNELDSIHEKKKQTCINKYGVEYTWQSDEVKDKIKHVNKEKYGTENISKSLFFQKKIFEKNYNRIVDSLSDMVEPCFKIEEYCGSLHQYSWKCKKCGAVFSDHLQNARIPRCHICFPVNKSSQENEIREWILSLGIEAEGNTKVIINPYELDIYIPSRKMAIEYDGLYWHSELAGKLRNYHLQKTSLCKEKGIDLIHIYGDEWNEKKDVVKSIIKTKLGIHDITVFARKTIIKEVEDTRDFLDNNHIQGYSSSSINLGLYYNEELISLATFGKSRYDKNHKWELLRFCNKLNYNIPGAFSKLIKRFITCYGSSIITYADVRLFSGSVYEKNGFKFLRTAKPDYFYTDYRKRYHRMLYQKKYLSKKLATYNPNLTEWENMQLNGWDRIWNCGNYVYSYQSTDSSFIGT